MAIDRKAAVQAYKETPRTAGVGVVRNTTNGRVLVVAGTDLPALLNRHRAELRMGGHRNEELQRDWKATGADAFTFEVVDTLQPPDEPGYDPTDDLKVLEQLWLEKLAPYPPAGYNKKPKDA